MVFDLSRSVDLHMESTAHTNETAIAGVKKGMMELDDWVTWRAKHLGVYWKLTSLITEYEYGSYFVDEMVNGPFSKLVHKHRFSEVDGYTIMVDEFEVKSPFGPLGMLVDAVFMKRYMHRFLLLRNQCIREKAESTPLD